MAQARSVRAHVAIEPALDFEDQRHLSADQIEEGLQCRDCVLAVLRRVAASSVLLRALTRAGHPAQPHQIEVMEHHGFAIGGALDVALDGKTMAIAARAAAGEFSMMPFARSCRPRWATGAA